MNRAVYWCGEVPTKDDFDNPITDVFYDGRTLGGHWALMNDYSFKMYGIATDTGVGQKYEKQEDGRWLKTQ